MRLSDFTQINPYEKLPKGTIAKKISMEQLEPYKKFVSGYSLEAYSGGAKFRNGDTIMARITPCLENGKTAFISTLDKNEVGFGSTEYIVFRAKDGISHPDFVYYLVISSLVREPAIKSMVGSSGRQRVQQTVIDELEIPNYSLAEQQHIVDILGSIDEKIENNRLLQQGLIAYGLKIFENRSRQSKTDHSFGELFSFINGFSFKSSDYKETGKYKVITIKNITDNGFNSDNADKIDYSDSFAKSRLSIGDILLTMTGEVGRVGIVDIDNALLNQRVLKVVGKSSFFTYFALLSNSNNIKTLAKGSVQQNLGLKELSKYLIACDNVESYKQYDWIITKLLSISKENKSLNALKQLYLKKFFG